MRAIDADLETLETAMREFFQIMKRPNHWAGIKQRSGVTIDRPSAVILKMLLNNAPAPCRVQDLANHLGVEAPFVTRKTQDLERAGYIRRIPDKHDRRAVDLHLTSRGRTITSKLGQAQREMIAETLENWKPSERRSFANLFARFSRDLDLASRSAESTAAHNQISHQEKTAGA